jgi:GTP-binding protein EngB required for normal cell division
MINPSESYHKISTADAVHQLAEVVADLIQHQKQTALVVQTLIDKVDKLEKTQANG